MAEEKKVKKTYNIRPSLTRNPDAPDRWHLVDAKGKVLGRLATQIAKLLMGKDKKTYVPYWESGDHIVVINAKEIKVTGKKRTEKIYDHYTGYPGGIRQYNFEKLIEKDPREVLSRAVKGMIPKNRLGDRMMTHLLIYPGAEHHHQAQNPTPVNF